jgi:hypothetical protein
MVKKLFVAFIVAFLFDVQLIGQKKNETECDSLFLHFDSILTDSVIITVWEKAPVITSCYQCFLNEVCPIVFENGYKVVMAEVIIDTLGNIKCIRFYPEINDALCEILSLKIKLLQFSPATQRGKPEISCFPLIINSTKCAVVDKNKKKKRWKNIFS